MLLRMRPDQVQVHWEEIKVAIYESLPIWTGERSSLMNDILIEILTDQIIVWISYQVIDGVNIMDAVARHRYNDFIFCPNRRGN